MPFIHWITGMFLKKKGGGQRKNLSKYYQIFIEVIFFFKWQDEISSEHNYFRLEMVPLLNSPVIVIVGVCVIQFP
jgi:hypothetical protein